MSDWKTYSVFISSTFSDMQSERDYLNMVVFPQINQELRHISVSLRTIDLRWGINTQTTQEESVENKVLKVCFDEIDRSKPFFIGLLGQRYGWIPNQIPQEVKRLNQGSKEHSITSMEIEYGFLNRNEINGCIFLERSLGSYENMDHSTKMKYDDACIDVDESEKNYRVNKLITLKNTIKSKLKTLNKENCYIQYSAQWDNDHFTSLEDFGEQVKRALLYEIYNVYGSEPQPTLFSEEQNRQEEFLYLNKAKIYERKHLMKIIYEKIKTQTGGLILKGDSGFGKSCVYTLVVDSFRREPEKYMVLYHTTATGQNSRHLLNMLKRWIFELEEMLELTHILPVQMEECEIYFKNLIKQIPKDKKLILCIDALDGFVRNEATDYLTFYPRSNMQNIFLFCTSLPANCQYPVKFNKSIALFDIPCLTEADAQQIIAQYITFYHKELYPQNIKTLLSVSNDRGYGYQSPLWLSISLHLLMAINRIDFETIASNNQSFDRTLQEYMDSLILSFPKQEDRLFISFLDRLERFYGAFPHQLFVLLSVSFNGLAEDILIEVMKENWDSRVFAVIRGYLGSYIAEQGEEKYWQIMHNKLKICLGDTERQEWCKKIAACYIERMDKKKVVNDNILYYLYHGQCYEQAYRYNMGYDANEDRFINELCRLSELIEAEELMEFLFRMFNRKSVLQRFMPTWIKINKMKILVEEIVKKKMHEGDYEKIPYMINTFQEQMESLSVFGDFKIYIYMTTDYLKLDALSYLTNSEGEIEAYKEAINHMKIRGLFSLLYVPLCRLYYKWTIFKLKK